MDEANRIVSTEELKTIRSAHFGFIVNVDLPTSTTTFHRPGCRTLTDASFDEKVIKNGGKTGGWYFQLHRRGAVGRVCSVCRST
jgi:hypothetical protein